MRFLKCSLIGFNGNYLGPTIRARKGEGSHERDSPGMLGDTILVNGTYAPYVEVPKKKDQVNADLLAFLKA